MNYYSEIPINLADTTNRWSYIRGGTQVTKTISLSEVRFSIKSFSWGMTSVLYIRYRYFVDSVSKNIYIGYFVDNNLDTYNLLTLRSFGESFYHHITDAALEFGYVGV